jgi:N utilization substance protein A
MMWLGDGKPTEDLLETEGMDPDLARLLAASGVCSRDDLADLATDELVEMTGIDEERAASLIMTARAAWFEEDEAEGAPSGG